MFNQYSKPILKGLIIYGTFFIICKVDLKPRGSYGEIQAKYKWNTSQIQVTWQVVAS